MVRVASCVYIAAGDVGRSEGFARTLLLAPRTFVLVLSSLMVGVVRMNDTENTRKYWGKLSANKNETIAALLIVSNAPHSKSDPYAYIHHSFTAARSRL